MGSAASKSGTDYKDNGTDGKRARLEEGDVVPNVTIKARVRITQGEDRLKSFAWKDITIEELFKGKCVAMFSIPGGSVHHYIYFRTVERISRIITQ
jgi:hypothetical protein